MTDFAAARINMVENQVRCNAVTDARLIAAMSTMPRELFVPADRRGVAYMDEEGYFFIVDRIKDLIINGGFNVYPRVVEEAIVKHPAVEEVTVIGAPDERRGEVPIAFVKLRTGMPLTERELLDFLEPTLNKLQMPREVIFKDSLPKTLIGKLSKKELREEYKAMKGKPS